MKSYTQFTQEERYQIHALTQAGRSQSEIAYLLKRSPSTISWQEPSGTTPQS